MVGKLNILKEKQNKTKQNNKQTNKQTKQENLTHLWDLRNKIITHLRSWKQQQTKTKQLAAKNSTQLPCPLKSK